MWFQNASVDIYSGLIEFWSWMTLLSLDDWLTVSIFFSLVCIFFAAGLFVYSITQSIREVIEDVDGDVPRN